MPFWFFLAIVCAVVAVIAGIVWFASRRSAAPAAPRPAAGDRHSAQSRFRAGAGSGPRRPMAPMVTAVAAVLAVFFILVSSWTQIGTQNVGIVTSFGRPVGDVGNGLHFLPPWDQVTEMDNAIQTDTYYGSNCIAVRIADQQTACVNARIRWQMRQTAADQLFRNYRTSGGVRLSLVTSELDVAMNQQFDGYDPIGSLTTTVPLGQPGNPTIAQIAQRVYQQMAHEIGGQVHVYSVLIPLINYDSTVQARLNSVLTQKASTDIALQAVKTAQAQAQANRVLAASVSNDPNVLVSRCLDLLSEMIKTNMTPPAGFSCWPGGSGTPVIAGKP